MNIYTCQGFEGHNPIGTAAVVVARDKGHARRVLGRSWSVTLWAIAPLLLGLALEAADASHETLGEFAAGNPVVHAVVIMEGASGEYDARKPLSQLDYDWPNGECDEFGQTTARLLTWSVVYVASGLGFAMLARVRLRRRIF